MHQEAIGMIETKGFPPAIEALDVMLKAANVTFAGSKRVGSGLITMVVIGDIGSVNAAVSAGQLAARKVGPVVSFHVIPRLYPNILTLFSLEEVAHINQLFAKKKKKRVVAAEPKPLEKTEKPATEQPKVKKPAPVATLKKKETTKKTVKKKSKGG